MLGALYFDAPLRVKARYQGFVIVQTVAKGFRSAISRVETALRAEGVSAESPVVLLWLKLALLITCVVPLLIFAAGAWDERAQLLQAAEGEAIASVAALREHALKTIETDELLLMAVDRRIAGMTWDDIRTSRTALSQEIGAMHAGMPQISLLAVTDTEGRIQAGTPPHGNGDRMSVAHQELWMAQRDADQGTFFSRAYVGRLTGARNFGISRRRSSPDGKFNGTIHVAVSASYFTSFWTEVIGGKADSVAALVRTDGEVLARLPEPPMPLGDIPKAGMFVRNLDPASKSGVVRLKSPVDGLERIYAYARVGNLPLVAIYALSVGAVLAPWWQHLLILGAFGAAAVGAIFLAILAVIWQLRTIVDERARRTAVEIAATQGQRMELLGQLSAGTAHDFANILQAMQAGATLISRRASEPDRVRTLARRLEEDVGRGASLAHRILDLVRRNQGESGTPAIVDTMEAVSSLKDLLRRIIGIRYQIRCEIDPDNQPAPIRVNRTDLEVAIMNLAVNARDAMPDGGDIVIRATTRTPRRVGDLRDETDRGTPLAGAPSVQISVTDTGTGMSPEVLARAGERFFTTKASGNGTGLGLASVREFVERAGGKMSIKSALGEGTTVTLWIPASPAAPVAETPMVAAEE